MRVLLMSDNRHARRLAAAAGRALTETAVAFGHSLIVKELNIGPEIPLAGTGAAADFSAAVAVCESRLWTERMALHLGCGLCLVPFMVHPAWEDLSPLRSGRFPRGILAVPLEPYRESEFLEQSMALAQRDSLALRQVSPPGAGGPGLPSSHNLPLLSYGEAVAALFHAPERMGFLAMAPEAFGAFAPLAEALFGIPSLLYRVYLAPSRVFVALDAPARSLPEDSFNPLGALYAAAALLARQGLAKEAECLRLSVENVIEAGWRTDDVLGAPGKRIGTQAMCALVFEQLGLVGQLVGH